MSMGWRAETDHGQIATNTVLSVYFQPWGAGVVVPNLNVGAEIAVGFPNGAVANVTLIELQGAEGVIQLANLTKWRIVHVALKELRFPPAGTADAPTTYWVVKEAIV
jgi:hypothetical protein